jgi:hypothetical protein
LGCAAPERRGFNFIMFLQSRRPRTVYLLVLFAVSMALVLAVSRSAQAKVAGANGEIAYVHFRPTVGDDTTYIVNPDGSNPRPVSPGMQTTFPYAGLARSELDKVADPQDREIIGSQLAELNL